MRVIAISALALGFGLAPSSGPHMERTPAYVLAYCDRSRLLPLACPHLLPRMSQPSPHWEANYSSNSLDLVDSDNGDRPPIWSHVVVEAGNLGQAYPSRGNRVTHLDGLFARARSRAVYIGTFTWGGRRGTVVLAPAYPAGGEQGDHLIFLWRAHGTELALGLHGWEPLSQAFATLRLMVLSI
jgi:hypothetical protein